MLMLCVTGKSQEQNAREKRWGFLLPHEHPGVLREFMPIKTNFWIRKGGNSIKKYENTGKPNFCCKEMTAKLYL